MGYEYMNDCIHLKACRRLQAMEKHKTPRYCTPKCSAYVSGDTGNYITVDEAISYAREGASSIESGYSGSDVYCSMDLGGQTIGEIVDEIQERGE
jgi:hypothetical protein